jgi:HAMP domain-containing protein
MRRSTLSTKLFAAALPLVLAVAALLAFTVRHDLRDVQQAENGAELGRVWQPLIGALGAIETEVADARVALTALEERRAAIDAADGVIGNLGAPEALAAEREAAARYDATTEPLQTIDLAAARIAADASLDQLVDAVDRLDGADSAKEYVTASRSSLLSGRRIVDRAVLAPDMLVGESDPIGAYERASRDLVAIGELLPSEAGDPELGGELLSVLKLARAKLAADDVITGITAWQAAPGSIAPLVAARQSFAELENSIAEFEAVAPEEWLLQYRNSGFGSMLAGFRSDLTQALTAVQGGDIASFDDVAFSELVRQGVGFQAAIAESIVERAEADVVATRTDSLRRIGITLGAVLLAALLAWFISRSITRRIKAVAKGANQVATEQLPALVEALQDPRGKAVLPDFEPVPARGSDELAELAQAFNSMQGTLVEVANEQVEVLRRGVSDIFVTMARRNRSLIDRQLAMLDEYEAEVDDPEILANYYQLDHLATRMRRNSESLLVLANAEPKRKRVKATEIDDVVRASIGEVEDYRRIEIESLESLQVRGNVVADISHLLAELLDNATSFSPPDSVVRVGGRRAGESYMLRIVDDGVGIGVARMRELNELLREPPIVGLSVESTLGMSVVSLLANKHGIKVTLAAGNPGLTVDVVLPSTVFGPIETPGLDTTPVPTLAAGPRSMMAEEQIVDWETQPAYGDGEDGFVREDEQPPIPAPVGYRGPAVDPYDDAPRVAAGDWTKMSLDLSAFKSGMASATTSSDADGLADEDVDGFADGFADEDADEVTFEPRVELDAFDPVFDDLAAELDALEPTVDAPDTDPAESDSNDTRVPEHPLPAGFVTESEAEPEPEPAPDPVPTLEPAATLDPEPILEPAATLDAEPTLEPEPTLDPRADPRTRGHPRHPSRGKRL